MIPLSVVLLFSGPALSPTHLPSCAPSTPPTRTGLSSTTTWWVAGMPCLRRVLFNRASTICTYSSRLFTTYEVFLSADLIFHSVFPSFFVGWQVSVLKLAPAGTRGPLACLFGVFDGHGGDGASKFVANHLHHLVRQQKLSHKMACARDA